MVDRPSRGAVTGLVVRAFDEQLDGLVHSGGFTEIEAGRATADELQRFLENVYRTHVKSPQIVAMLYATSAPAATPSMLRNLCDELGLPGDGPSHPMLLRKMLDDLGVDATRQRALEADAERNLLHLLSQPLMFPTLRETALGMLLEVSSFEWALSRVAGRLATAIERHWGLSPSTLRWFTIHAAVDVRHAAEAVDAVADFVEFFAVDAVDLQTVIELTFRQNVLVRRYFPTEGRWGYSEAATS